MNVCILNPSYGENFVRVARWAAKSRGRVQRHPEYLLTAAQVLIDQGHQVTFVEAAARNLPLEKAYDHVMASKPDLLVIHATTPSIYQDIIQAREIKEVCQCKVAFVGQHVSAEVENTFSTAKGVVDYILRGEYDFTLRDIASGQTVSEISGLSWIDDNKVIHNPQRPLLNMNELPFPAWQLIQPEWYPDAGKKFPFLTLLTGRGCNNACTFCRDPQVMYGRKLRLRDPQKVVDEIEYDLTIHPQIREIMFETDTFVASSEHVEEICREIIKRRLHKRMSWACNTRVNTNLSLMPLMREAGCRMLMTGFEFGYDEGLKAVKKGGVNIDMARQFAWTARKHGFTVHGCFMIGAPGETRETARKTIDFAKSIPMDTAQFTGIAVYPGTELYHWAKEHDYITAKDWDEWLTAEHEQKTLLNYPQLSHEEIDEFIDKGLKEFYMRPGQMWAMLISIRSIGDLLRKVFGVKAFADYFFKKTFEGTKTAQPAKKYFVKKDGAK
ncbi:MAG: B12-binding domain-containing radical SAM protein [Candidatus Omnitrophica bacterium]|nr:B12-binding domain-containing radical SAM protein [Candidatus Omnitrophota bacterium]